MAGNRDGFRPSIQKSTMKLEWMTEETQNGSAANLSKYCLQVSSSEKAHDLTGCNEFNDYFTDRMKIILK